MLNFRYFTYLFISVIIAVSTGFAADEEIYSRNLGGDLAVEDKFPTSRTGAGNVGGFRTIQNLNDLMDSLNGTYNYVVDASEADQGVASGESNKTVYDIAVTASTTNYVLIHLSHNPGDGNTTTYTWDTSDDFSSNPNLFFLIDPGARIARTTGDETITFYSPANIIVSQRQQITAVDMIRFANGGDVYPQWWGAKGDGSTNDYSAFYYAFESGDIDCRALAGDYVLGTTLVLPSIGSRLIGDGARKTTIRASHSSGAVVQTKYFYQSVSNLTIDATSARTNGVVSGNYGILHEAVDDVGQFVKFADYNLIEIRNQPSHGIVFIGFSEGSSLDRFYIHDNGGDAIVCDNGTITGRSNLYQCGMIDIVNGSVKDNTGHGLRVGGLSENNNAGFRLYVKNVDFVRNALAAGVRKSAHSLWLYATSSTIVNCGIGGFNDSYESTIGGINISGYSNRILSNRYVGVTPEAIKIGADSSGIVVDELYVIDPLDQPDLNPAVSVRAGAERITVRSQTLRYITNLVRDDANNNVPGTVLGAPELVIKRSTQTVNNSTTLVNDDDLFFPIKEYESVYFEVIINHVGNSTADFKCSLTAPANATIRWLSKSGLVYGADDSIAIDSRSLQSGTKTIGGSTAVRSVTFSGYAKAGDTAGNIQFQWSQNTAAVVDTQVVGGSLGGSCIIVFRE